MVSTLPGVDPAVVPSGTGCVECEAASGFQVRLPLTAPDAEREDPA